MSFIVFKFSSISSPVIPSPLDNPFTKIPFSYVKAAEIPSIFNSDEKLKFSFLTFK